MMAIFEEIEKFARLQREYKEKTLAEIITKYDFVVGSKECKYRLMEILPEGANIICSPYIENPTMIYAIKKFDIIDYINEPQESEEEEGEWADQYNDGNWHCSKCGAIVEKDEQINHNWYFCYHCGTKMKFK